MIPEFLITFREALEASLVVGIILAFLEKTKQSKLSKHVYFGIAAGIVCSIIFGFIIYKFFGGLEGSMEQIFEGTTMFIASIMLTYMIFWMMKQKHVAKEIENKVQKQMTEHSTFGLFMVSFISVFREGIETVLFLAAATFTSTPHPILGSLLGIAVAVFVGFLLFELNMHINIKQLFNISSILLLLFSAGLIAHGIHEYQEADLLPFMKNEMWNTHNLLDEKSFGGEIAKSILGYNENPSSLEVIGYLSYLALIGLIYKKLDVIHKYL